MNEELHGSDVSEVNAKEEPIEEKNEKIDALLEEPKTEGDAKGGKKKKSDDDLTPAELRKKKRRRLLFQDLIIAASVIVGLFIIFSVSYHFLQYPLSRMLHEKSRAAAPDRPSAFDDDESGILNGLKKPSTSEKQDVYNILVSGYDRVGMLADVSLLINFNVKTLEVHVMQIPRDTHVQYSLVDSYSGGEYVYGYDRINGVFGALRVNQIANERIASITKDIQDDDLRGITAYAAFLERAFHVRIDYYAVMDLNQFANIVDLLGGVEMYVPQYMEYVDPNQNLYISLSEGYQTLNGKQAEQVVRFRATYAMADIGRGNVQKLFMASLLKTVKTKINLFNFNDLCNAILDNLVTNMTFSDLYYFTTFGKTVDLKYVTFMTIPGWFYGAEYTICREAALDAINKYFNTTGTEITSEQFDVDNYFYNEDPVFSMSKEVFEANYAQYIYTADEMTNGEFQPER